MTSAAVRSKAMVPLSSVYFCPHRFGEFILALVLLSETVCVFSSFTIISLGKRERESWLLNWCYIAGVVICLFPTVPLVGPWCVIVAFPGHTHILYWYTTSPVVTCVPLYFKTCNHIFELISKSMFSIYMGPRGKLMQYMFFFKWEKTG